MNKTQKSENSIPAVHSVNEFPLADKPDEALCCTPVIKNWVFKFVLTENLLVPTWKYSVMTSTGFHNSWTTVKASECPILIQISGRVYTNIIAVSKFVITNLL